MLTATYVWIDGRRFALTIVPVRDMGFGRYRARIADPDTHVVLGDARAWSEYGAQLIAAGQVRAALNPKAHVA